MAKFNKTDISNYYSSTHTHYEQWWGLKNTLSLHYGIWDETTKNFAESLVNTNKVLFEKGKISDGDYVLDAGCGVGGAAFFMLHEKKVRVEGITLSEKQIKFAQEKAKNLNLSERVSFHLMDYTQTTFPDETFDVVWACESCCHATNKSDFIKEAYRILKKGGRLVLVDYFLESETQKDENSYIEKWITSWAISNLVSREYFTTELQNHGFKNIQLHDYTKAIYKSARRMYLAGIVGGVVSKIYNAFHPNVTPFAKTHSKSVVYQYKALNKNLWKYVVFSAEK
ncbi:MAG: methyltransferase domain-containing protein [Bacteroidetes bacterium]|nr:methyltransferase domain-containing protein [Bacteroidota bacterium]